MRDILINNLKEDQGENGGSCTHSNPTRHFGIAHVKYFHTNFPLTPIGLFNVASKDLEQVIIVRVI